MRRAAGWAPTAVSWRTGPRRLLAFFQQAGPRGAAPSGWALALDAVIAVGAAIGAVYEVAQHGSTKVTVWPGGPLFLGPHGAVLIKPARLLFGPAMPAHPSFAALGAAALTALPLAGRRLYPITAWLVIAAAIVLVHPTEVPPVALGTAVFAAYSAVTHSRYRNLAIAVVTLVTVAVAGTLGDQLPRFPGRLTALFALFPTAAAGLGIRSLRLRLADSAARLRRAAIEAEAETRRALAAERSRIAGELHDVVTHNVAVMLIQAGAARKILADSPADAEDALLAVEATGRDAMTDLRNLLGLLNPAEDGSAECPGGEAALRPQPGLGELGTLVDRVRTAGLPVDLNVSGDPRALPTGADLAAFRVVQEGLTNVLRHAGPASAAVEVQWGDSLVITVSDDGRGSDDGQGSDDGRGSDDGPAGRGLLGLRERLALYGGELAAGPGPGGGWRLRAVLPGGTAS